MEMTIPVQNVDRLHRAEEVDDTKEQYTVLADDLSLAFGGNRILDAVSFVLPPGRTVLLRGENGSGKTTLLNVLNGFIRPDSGRLRFQINGAILDVRHHSPERLACEGIGRLWQDIRLFPNMTVLDNVLAASPRLRELNPVMALSIWPPIRRMERAAREHALHHLHTVGMADRASSSADKLSVGQMKKVAIARLLQTEAELLLLDEPLSGLDPSAAEDILLLLKRLNKDGKTMLIAEHQYERMAAVCSDTWFLAEGRISVQAEAA